MPCVHLKQLFQLCQDNELKVSSAELIHFVCEKCNQQEVCPTNLMDEHSLSEDFPASDEVEGTESPVSKTQTSEG